MQISKQNSLSKTCITLLFHGIIDPYLQSRFFLALWHRANFVAKYRSEILVNDVIDLPLYTASIPFLPPIALKPPPEVFQIFRDLCLSSLIALHLFFVRGSTIENNSSEFLPEEFVFCPVAVYFITF